MTVEPPDSPACRPADAGQLRAGSLSYTRAGLARLFGWLLAGDLVFVLVDQIEPRLMPVVLKQHGASDSQIAFIVSSIPSILMLIVNPIVSYRSDRTTSRWGRRIPYLAAVTPFVSLFLALTCFAPEIARACSAHPKLAGWMQHTAIPPVVLTFGILVFCYHMFKSVVPAVFFSLLRDVVPVSHLGRFMSLFRVVGAVATFALTYWLLGIVDTRSKLVFLSVAAMNLVAFAAICLFVREGRYPPVVDKIQTRKGPLAAWDAVRNYVSECFSSPVYWWMYCARLLVYAAMMMMGFLIFFPQYDLGLGLETSARLTAWPALVWLIFAYPVGILIDRWGPIRVFTLSLALNSAAYILTFLFVRDRDTFFVSALLTGTLFWMVMLSQLVFLQLLVHPQRVSQISSANALLQAIVIAAIISPLFGWYLDAIKEFRATWSIPGYGSIAIGPYRFVNLVMALFFLIALFCVRRARAHWLRLGGPDHYQAPL